MQGFNHHVLFLDGADQVGDQVRCIDTLVIWAGGVVDRMHQLGHHLFDFLGDESDVGFGVWISAIGIRFNFGFPLVGAGIQGHDLVRGGFERGDIGFEARIGCASERCAARSKVDSGIGLVHYIEDTGRALADVIVGGGVLVRERQIGTVDGAIGSVHDGDVGGHLEVGGEGSEGVI